MDFSGHTFLVSTGEEMLVLPKKYGFSNQKRNFCYVGDFLTQILGTGISIQEKSFSIICTFPYPNIKSSGTKQTNSKTEQIWNFLSFWAL